MVAPHDFDSAKEYLEKLVQADKAQSWIRDDLKIQKKSKAGKTLWKVLNAMSFTKLREKIFRAKPETLAINLKKLKTVLLAGDASVQDKKEALFIYKTAIQHFNQIFPNHQIHSSYLDEIDAFLFPPSDVEKIKPKQVKELQHAFDEYLVDGPPLPNLDAAEVGTYALAEGENGGIVIRVKEPLGVTEYVLRQTIDNRLIVHTSSALYPGPFHKESHESLAHFILKHPGTFKTFCGMGSESPDVDQVNLSETDSMETASTLDESSETDPNQHVDFDTASEDVPPKASPRSGMHGNISAREAMARLSGYAPGTYLIRTSEDVDYIVDFVATDGSLKEIWVEFKNNRYQAIAENTQVSVPSFASLEEMVAIDNNLHFPLRPAKRKSQPKPVNANMAKWAYCENVVAAIEKGKSPQQLLQQAITDKQVEVALWLIKNKGAVLNEVAVTEENTNLHHWLSVATQTVALEPANLDHFALDVGYGYKSANLMLFDQSMEAMRKELKSADVRVPSFLPITHFELSHFLTSAMPEVQALWIQFQNTFDQEEVRAYVNQFDDGVSVQPPRLTDAGQAYLKQIQGLITDYFTANCYLTLQIKEWLEKEAPELLIVRSTGQEDSETNSNAGGNESIPFVAPDPVQISITIGKVLASYFGEKSIRQRLLAGDGALFVPQQFPFMPVLLQTMVMETGDAGFDAVPKEVPRPGVMFSSQNGVTYLQSALGTNDTVVAGLGAVDTFLVDDALHVHAVLREKKTRFVRMEMADGTYESVQIENKNREMERAQSLPVRVVRDLKRVADAASSYYSNDTGALDIEFMVKLSEKNSKKPVIYLLQVRPLLQSNRQSVPSFIQLDRLNGHNNDDDDNDAARIYQVKVLIDIQNNVRTITSSEQAIFADTLPKALESYTKADDSQQIQAVFVKKSAPGTSHEAVFLRPKGVIVIWVDETEDFAALQHMILHANERSPVLIDGQRGLVVAPGEHARVENLITPGLVSFPAPLEVSIPLAPAFYRALNAKNPEEFHTILSMNLNFDEASYQRTLTKLLGKDHLVPQEYLKMPLRKLIDIIAAKGPDESKKALAAILVRLHSSLKKNVVEIENFREKYNIPLYSVFQYVLGVAENEILPSLNQTTPQSLERLFPLKFLEAAIFQKPDATVVQGISYAVSGGVAKGYREAVQAATEIGVAVEKQEDIAVVNLLQIGLNHAISSKASAAWKEFAKEAQASMSTEDVQLMSSMLKEMQELKVLQLWISLEFAKNWKKGDALSIFQNLKKMMNENRTNFAWVAESRKQLPGETEIASYSDPGTARENLPRLKERYLNAFGFGRSARVPFRTRINTASGFGRVALLQFFGEAVNAYDAVVKQMNGSTQFPADRKEQAALFAEALEGYHEMMRSSFRLLNKQDEVELLSCPGYKEMTLDEYTARLKNGHSYNFGTLGAFRPQHQSLGFSVLSQLAKSGREGAGKGFIATEQFAARPQFNVNTVMIGSKADMDFSVHWPTNLEEYFTTFHQNMEMVHRHLLMKCGINAEVLDEQPKETCRLIGQVMKTNISSIVEDEDHQVVVTYQIPLRQHAGVLKILYDPQKPEAGIDISVDMMGNHEHNRWYIAAYIGAWLGNLPGISFTNNIEPAVDWSIPEKDLNAVSFSLHVKAGYPQMQKLVDALNYMMRDMTMEPTTERFVIDELLKIGSLKELNPRFFRIAPWTYGEVFDRLEADRDYRMTAQVVEQTSLGIIDIKNLPHDRQLATIKRIIRAIAFVGENAPEELLPFLDRLALNPEIKVLLKISSSEFWGINPRAKVVSVPALKELLDLYPDIKSKSKLTFGALLTLKPELKNLIKLITYIQAERARIKVELEATLPNGRTSALQVVQQMTESQIDDLYSSLNPSARVVFADQYLPELNVDLGEIVASDARHLKRRLKIAKEFEQNFHQLRFAEKPATIDDMSVQLELARKVIQGAYQSEAGRAQMDHIAVSQIKGLIIAVMRQPELQADVMKMMEKLTNDYMDFGRFEIGAEEYGALLRSFTKIFYEMNNTPNRVHQLTAMWRNSPTQLYQLYREHKILL